MNLVEDERQNITSSLNQGRQVRTMCVRDSLKIVATLFCSSSLEIRDKTVPDYENCPAHPETSKEINAIQSFFPQKITAFCLPLSQSPPTPPPPWCLQLSFVSSKILKIAYFDEVMRRNFERSSKCIAQITKKMEPYTQT